MSKKRKIIAISAILLAIIVSFIGGNTFSKYITEVKGTGVAEVAKWYFKVNGSDEQVQNIDLISNANGSLVSGSKIAPGTSGSFKIMIDASECDVALDYTLKVQNQTVKPANLVFKYGGKTYQNIEQIAQEASSFFNANSEAKTLEIPISWEWPYVTGTTPTQIAENDKRDTQDGKNISQYSFDLVVTAVQKQVNA